MSLVSATPDGRISTRTSTLVAWSLVVAIALTVAVSSLGSYQTLGTHEVVAAEPARAMLHSGDWIVPRYGDVPRIRKPPLVYWLVASSGWLFGEFSEFAVRFHSAIAFLGMVALMSLWAARWYGREAAFGAAIVQTTSFWAIFYGRHVEIDMVMCLLTTAAMFLIATQPADEPASRARWRWIGILTLIGLTWLAKFHYGTTMVFGPVFVLWALQRQWRKWLNFVNPIGLLILIACLVIWPWLLLRECPEALDRWRFETVGRATGEIGYVAWWFYGPQLLLFSLPWLGHVLFAVPPSWRRAWRHGDERERFLWIWLVADVVVISLSPNKHANYLLAAMPVTTLLASQSFARGLARFHRDALRIPKLVPHVVASTVVVIGVAINWLVTAKSPAIQAGILGATGVGLCGVILIWWCWQRKWWSAAGWTALASALGALLVVLSVVTPELDRHRITVEFAQQLRQEVLRDQPVCVYVRKGTLPGFHPSIFYLDEPVYQVSTLAELLQEVKRSGDLLAVVERESLPRFRTVAPFVDLQEIARMTQMVGSREAPLVCVRLTDRREIDRPTATATKDSSTVAEPTKRR